MFNKYMTIFIKYKYTYIIIFLIIIIIFFIINNLIKLNNKEKFAGFADTKLNDALNVFYQPNLYSDPGEKNILIPSDYTSNNKIIDKNIELDTIISVGTPYMVDIFSRIQKLYYNDKKVILNYNPVGSIEGIELLKKGKADFCATTVKYKELTTENNYNQFPIIIGGVVPIVNIPGIEPGTLILNGLILAKIFLKIITRWDHEDIIKINSENKDKLKGDIITVFVNVRHGLNYCLSKFLSSVSKLWELNVGIRDLFKIPYDKYTKHGKNDNEISDVVSNNVGSIGYVDYNYIVKKKLNYIILKNLINDKYSYPSKENFLKFYSDSLENTFNGDSWPIIIIVYCLINRNPSNIKKSNLFSNDKL